MDLLVWLVATVMQRLDSYLIGTLFPESHQEDFFLMRLNSLVVLGLFKGLWLRLK